MPSLEIVKALALGFSAGILSGMFGIGGGLVIVPLLMLVLGYDPKTAVGTSLFSLLLPTGALGALEYWRRGEIRLLTGLMIAFGLFCGAYFGARLTAAISTATMKRLYGLFLIVVAVYFLASSTSGPPGSPARPRPSPSPGSSEPAAGGPGAQAVH